jgi:hypothetical protein
MTLIACSQCGQQFEDDVLCCPHCGTAQIPQLSKAQLRMRALKASRGPFGAILAGTGIGLLIGIIILVIAILRGEFDIAKGVYYVSGVLIGGMLGGACGIVFHYLRLDVEAKKEAERQLPPDQLNRT